MARFAFVTRKGLDLISEAPIPCSCAGVAPYMALESFGYRVVFGFFVGQFTLDEIDRFMTDVAASSGSAGVAGDYFKSFEHESRVSTGGISFQKNVLVPNIVQNIIDEYNEVKLSIRLPSNVSKRNGLGPFLPSRWCACRKRYSECLHIRVRHRATWLLVAQ